MADYSEQNKRARAISSGASGGRKATIQDLAAGVMKRFLPGDSQVPADPKQPAKATRPARPPRFKTG